jgi:hypothetical protein
MQFLLVVTDRSGLGISWDEEIPPVYENIPASPPPYGTTMQIDEPTGLEAFGCPLYPPLY